MEETKNTEIKIKSTTDKFKLSKVGIDFALNQAVKGYFSMQTADGL